MTWTRRRISIIILAVLVAGPLAISVAAQAVVSARSIYLGATGTTVRIRAASGTPEGSLTGAVGELYVDTATGDIYRKASGAGNTGWVPGSIPSGAQYNVPYFTSANSLGSSSTFTFDSSSALTLTAVPIKVLGGMSGSLAATRYGIVLPALFQSASATDFGTVHVALGANAFSAWQEYVKSRSTDGSTLGIVANNDEVGRFNFAVDDGTDWQSTVARIVVEVDGTPAANDTPGRMRFYTTPAASPTPIERFSISSTGLAKFHYGQEEAGQTLRTGVISPTQIVANTDNWNPTNLATANVIRINVDAARNITGIVAQTSGTMLLLYNTTTFTITLKHDVTSTAANRFYGPGDVDFSLTAHRSVWVRYDGTHSRWTIIS
jgi:hypothetical protein